MESKALEKSSKLLAVSSIDDNVFVDLKKGSFSSKWTSYMQVENDLMCLNYFCVNLNS